MKRSEMLAAIETAILNSVGTDPDTGAIFFPNLPGYMGGKVLNTIEEMGMLPPIEPGRTVYDLDLGIPEWEDENEA